MDGQFCYEIRVLGHLAERWSDWFGGLAIHNEPGGEATLTGVISDQAALIGALNQVQALNLTLVSLRRWPVEPSETAVPGDI
jgi:hypothetical protein